MMTYVNLLKSTGAGTNLSTSNLSTLLFKLLKLAGILFSLSVSNLSALDLKLAKSTFLVNFMYQHLLYFLNLLLLHNQINLIQLLHLHQKILVLENIHSFILCLFYLSSY